MLLSLNAEHALPLVEQIVDGVRTQIEDRLLRPGARVPAIRQLAERHGISRFTVVEAYDRLVAQGYLQSRRGAGFFVAPREERVAPALPAAQRQRAFDVAWLMRRGLADTPGVLKLSAGWLPPSWMDQEGVQRALRTVARGDGTRFGCYGEPLGFAPLREQLSRRMAAIDIETHPEQIVLTWGASQALDIIARHFIHPGDAVLVDDPGYYTLFGALRLLGARLIGVPRREDGPDPEALERLAAEHKPKLFFTQSVLHNPTGYNLSAASAYRVLQAATRHDFVVVEDDTYADFYPGTTTRLASLDQLRRVLYVGSFSKTLSANLRVGYLAASPDLAAELADIKLLTSVGTSELVEQVVHRMLIEGHYRKHVERIQNRLAEASARAAKVLDAHGLAFCQPDGGLFLWAAMPGMEDATPVAEAAEAANIVLAPGRLFRPQLQPTPYLRFNVAYGHDLRFGRFLSNFMSAK
ncbi:aminotransferase-like domain-containing protein [Uliginosibacterium sp. H1]|uniref:aminotransferase-like domain-containing protein n=1 Tax=Uliginosibacterium sp. H1 TaxID=3114757 RepID=UPI002E180379|nr:PLP-dependent aminotransferase family protein [Uliginosibacterium sp. H1]